MLLTPAFDEGVLVVRPAPALGVRHRPAHLVTTSPNAAARLASNTCGPLRVCPSVAQTVSEAHAQPVAPGHGARP